MSSAADGRAPVSVAQALAREHAARARAQIKAELEAAPAAEMQREPEASHDEPEAGA